jgi:hypothetical protein
MDNNMNNNSNELTIEQIKQSLDIIKVAEMYGELKKSGANGKYIYKKDKSISFDENKQIFKNWNGSMNKAGSVLDLIMLMENKSMLEAIQKMKDLSSLDTYTIDPALQIKRKKEAKAKKQVDFQKLQQWGTQELQSVGIHRPIECKDKNGKITHFLVPNELEKFFETKEFPAEYKKKIDYIFSNLIGWNKHFQCSSIVIKDDIGRIVDLIAYRPNKPDSYNDWNNPKYIYKNSHNRGESFLYPFRKEVESILFKPSNTDKYLIVGEGIKNGLNAILYSVPFIPLESTSNKISDSLIAYIRNLHEQGFSVISMFDGDKAGAKAHENFVAQSGLQINNFLAFDSGLDFVEYLQSGANNE